jgi:hypothetical protein
VKVADICPAGTTICGNVAASSMRELASVTTVPPAGAPALSVIVHVAESPLPPATIDGLHVSELAVCACAFKTSSADASRADEIAKPMCCDADLHVTMPSRVVRARNFADRRGHVQACGRE